MSEAKLMRAMNLLAKWRTVFAGWQLGTRPKGEPECDAVRDHREATILLRAEVSGLTKLLLDKKVFTLDELQDAFTAEAEALSGLYEEKFPGFSPTEHGMAIDPMKARETMRGWKP